MESEKLLEKKLKKRTEEYGGMCIKLICTHLNGLPDRLLLLPGGRLLFVEVKTTKQTPRRIQTMLHNKLKKLGFEVYVVDTTAKINQLFNE